MPLPAPLNRDERVAILRRVLVARLNGINIQSICGEYNCACHDETLRWESTVRALEAMVQDLEERVTELENARADAAPSGAGREMPMTD